MNKKINGWFLLIFLLGLAFSACNDSAPSTEHQEVDHTDNNDTMNRVIDSLRTHHLDDSGHLIDTR